MTKTGTWPKLVGYEYVVKIRALSNLVVRLWHFPHLMLLGNTENDETIHFYSFLHDSQEIDCITQLTSHFIIHVYTIFIDVGQHIFSPSLKMFAIFSKIHVHVEFGCTMRIIIKKINFHHNLMILHLLWINTQVLKYKLAKCKKHICNHLRNTLLNIGWPSYMILKAIHSAFSKERYYIQRLLYLTMRKK